MLQGRSAVGVYATLSDRPLTETPMKTIESINLIYRDPKVRGGRPCIVGTGLRVMDIVLEQRHGESREAEKIAGVFEVGLAEVHAALAYYHAHKDEIDSDICEDDAYFEQLKAEGVVKPIDSLHP